MPGSRYGEGRASPAEANHRLSGVLLQKLRADLDKKGLSESDLENKGLISFDIENTGLRSRGQCPGTRDQKNERRSFGAAPLNFALYFQDNRSGKFRCMFCQLYFPWNQQVAEFAS